MRMLSPSADEQQVQPCLRGPAWRADKPCPLHQSVPGALSRVPAHLQARRARFRVMTITTPVSLPQPLA